MSITVKLITKKLGFLSLVQPMMCSRSRVILVHRRFLTSQTQSSYLEKFPETRCLPNTCHNIVKLEDNIPNSKSKCICFGPVDSFFTGESSRPVLKDIGINQHNCVSILPAGKVIELEHSLRLFTKPSLGTSDDINVRENYLSFNANNQEGQPTRLSYSSSKQSEDKSSNQNIGGRPSDEQLITVRESLANALPMLFVKTMDFRIYHPNIVFINNLRGTESKGLFSYIRLVSMLRFYGHVKFAYVKFEILKITSHPEDGTVRVRWRIRGIKGYMAVWNLLRHASWRPSEQRKRQDLWYDGFSTYFVGSDGRIFKHIADKVMPDDDTVVVEKTKGTPLAPKLAALCVGLALSSKDSILFSNRTDTGESQNL